MFFNASLRIEVKSQQVERSRDRFPLFVREVALFEISV